MKLVQKFNELNKNNSDIAGGKGASLGEMTQIGIPVPPGFVILAESFEQFIRETDLVQEIGAILEKVDHKAIHTVEAASENIRALILSRDMPKDIADEISKSFKELDTEYVAVRSSATAEDGMDHAWAGQLESYLNTTEDEVLNKVKLCWSSLFTPRAIFYRFEKGLHDTKISVAVVVQKMVESEVSGIAFSVHPVTEDHNQLIIEAGFGLGEAIVSGTITPDSYVVEKEPRNILDINLSTQTRGLYRASKFSGEHDNNEWVDIPEPKASSQVLTKEQILELSEIILHIEKHYGFPCDIEWAYEAGKFYIVQSRPITTLSEKLQKVSPVFEKVFARDFCMIALEIAAFSEKREDKEWMIESNPYKPYMLIERTDGTCNIWYNKKGVRWTNETLLQRVKADEDFLKNVEKEVRQGIAFIRSLYEKQEAVNRNELIRFIDEFLKSYSWIEAMWWIKSMESEDIGSGHEDIVKLRGQTEMLSAGTEIVIRKSLENLYPELGILSSMIRLEELKIDSIPSKEELQKRLDGFTIVDGELELKTLDEVAAENDLFLEKNTVDLKATEIKGEIAYKGKVRGRVCRVMGHIDFGKIQEGEILVSPMTMVDFLPEMRKAAAFITDEGGITCHAAIVAREMKKPCITGTKIATQVLKDGDEVEVDADKGVVTIIERAKKNVYVFKSPELNGFNPDNYEFTGLWKNDLFATCFWQDCYVAELLEELHIQLKDMGTINLNGGHFFVSKLVKDSLSEQIGKRIEEGDSAFFDHMKAVSDRIFAEGREVGELLRGKEANLENFLKFTNMAKRLNLLWLLGAAYFTEVVERKLQDVVIKESFPAEHVLDIIPKIITPLYYRNEELIKFKRAVGNMSYDEISKDTKLNRKLEEQVEEYPWVEVMNFIGKPMTPKRLFEQVEHMEDISQPPEYIPSKPLTSELVFITKCLQTCGYIKQAGAEYFSIFSERVLPFLHNVAKEIGVSYKELMSLGIWEIEQALKGELSASELKKRANERIGLNNWIIISDHNGKIIFADDPSDIEFLKNRIIPRADKNEGEIMGVVGNPGKYTGPVSVIMNTHDFHKMQAGDVLVTTMTTPDFVILMQKSGAIVTDIGGLLCHAAIISRELGKPCVIGTKFATQILKDGDMVEVDADKGVVRILK